jgi:hypothetical protein
MAMPHASALPGWSTSASRYDTLPARVAAALSVLLARAGLLARLAGSDVEMHRLRARIRANERSYLAFKDEPR